MTIEEELNYLLESLSKEEFDFIERNGEPSSTVPFKLRMEKLGKKYEAENRPVSFLMDKLEKDGYAVKSTSDGNRYKITVDGLLFYGDGGYSAKSKHPIDIEPEAPKLLKQIKWLQLHGRKNWKLLLVALLFITAYPVFKIVKDYYPPSQTPELLGDFKISFLNHSTELFELDNPGEFYLHAPEAPGVNRQISSGLIELQFDSNQYTLQIKPSTTVTIPARIINESRLMQYLDSGEYFSLIIFSASPKPIQTEVLFARKTLKNGIEFLIEDINKSEGKLKNGYKNESSKELSKQETIEYILSTFDKNICNKKIVTKANWFLGPDSFRFNYFNPSITDDGYFSIKLDEDYKKESEHSFEDFFIHDIKIPIRNISKIYQEEFDGSLNFSLNCECVEIYDPEKKETSYQQSIEILTRGFKEDSVRKISRAFLSLKDIYRK